MGKWKIPLVLVLCVALGACSAGPAPTTPAPTATETPTLQFGAQLLGATTVPAAQGLGIPSVVDRVSPSVVGLAVTTTQPSAGGQTVEGLGTGVIVDARGFILTNNHVAGNATQIDAVFADGSHAQGKTIWTDAALDLAVVKIAGGPYPAAEMGTSQNLKVGDTVVAIGTPLTLNFQHTVTSGIVSALRRTLKVPTDTGLSFMEELIQTDAPINPGNSGGPLCDMAGRVVGINTLKVSEAEGIGFAIPIEVARPIVQRIVAEGTYSTPYVGLFTIDAGIARYYGETGVNNGVLVLNVDPDGPGAAAGLRKGDLLTKLDGKPVDTVLAMRQAIYAHKPGEKMQVSWERDGQTGEVSVTLASKPVE